MSMHDKDGPGGVPQGQIDRLRWLLLERMRSLAAGSTDKTIPETGFAPGLVSVVRAINTMVRLLSDPATRTVPASGGISPPRDEQTCSDPEAVLGIAIADLAIELAAIADHAARNDFSLDLDTAGKTGFALVLASDINRILSAARSQQFELIIPPTSDPGH